MIGKKATRRSFLISITIHGILFVVLAFYIFSLHERVEEVIDLAFLEPVQSPPKPRSRQPYVPKALPEPMPMTEEFTFVTKVAEAKAPAMRGILSAGPARSTVKPATVTEYSSQRIMQGVSNPSLEAAAKVTSQITTNAKISQVADVRLGEPSSVPGESAAGSGLLGEKTTTGGSGGEGSGLGRGSFSGGDGQGGKGGIGKTPTGIASLTKITDSTSVSDSLKDISGNVSLGDMPMPPLPKGEPGGRVIGRGKDIKGVVRFTRLKHRLSDWWADPTSIMGLVKWINARTQIRADLNVEGGAIELTNPNLMKAPLVIMTGHAPSVVRQRMGQFSAVQATSAEKRLMQPERVALRKYLVEKGGLLFYDDCGLNSRHWPLMQTLLNELRDVMPEYSAAPIPNDHELYSCFYELGGAPWGVASLWKHDGPIGPIPERLKGILIGDRLAIVLSQRDYLCGAKTVNVHAGKVHKLSGAYQFLTNVVVYALTHGKISDYSNYVPNIPSTQLSETAPIAPPATPNLK